MEFNFFSPTKIIFGPGTTGKIAQSVKNLGGSALIVTGKDTRRATSIIADLEQAGICCTVFSQPTEPLVEDVVQGGKMAGELGVDFILALGGGSVLDAAKAISALAVNTRDIYDYLEVIGRGMPLEQKSLPLVAIPTTAGTGAEVTCNAVLGSRDYGVKVSMRSPFLYPYLVIVDPALTLSMPQRITAETGMDALTQLMEAFVTPFSSPITDALCIEGLKRVAKSFVNAFKNGQDIEARQDMCIASLLGGLVLANAKLGAVHGIAGPLGGMIKASHGLICARFLAPVTELNITRLAQLGSTNDTVLEKYRKIAVILTRDSTAQPGDGVDFIKKLAMTMELSMLKKPGLDGFGCKELAEKALASSSIKGNPVKLTSKEILALVEDQIGVSQL